MEQIFFKLPPNFTVRELKCIETKVAEEYWWTITQAACRSCCGRSDSVVLELLFQLDCLICTYIVDHMYRWSAQKASYQGPGKTSWPMVLHFRYSLREILLASNLPERNHRVNRGVSTQNWVSGTSYVKWPSVIGNHAFKKICLTCRRMSVWDKCFILWY
jgi:hypothetical protein